MLLLKIIILTALVVVFIQDILHRSVYWIAFPLLAISFICFRLFYQPVTDILRSSAVNLGFLILQLLLVTAYFSIKSRQIINITERLLGWGDVLFLASTAFYFSVLNFLFFYTISLLTILFFWLNWRLLVKIKNAQIPLAGLQALILILGLASDWWYMHLDLTSDDWLLKFVAK